MTPRPLAGATVAPWVEPRLVEASRLARADAPRLTWAADACAPRWARAETRARLLLGTVQGLTRWHVHPGETVTRPLATWARGSGDCGDAAPLLAALATAAGIPARLVYVSGRRWDHLVAQLWVGGAWRWAEATVLGAELGEEPTAAAQRLGIRRADLDAQAN